MNRRLVAGGRVVVVGGRSMFVVGLGGRVGGRRGVPGRGVLGGGGCWRGEGMGKGGGVRIYLTLLWLGMGEGMVGL